jgi:hypothetical protein
MASSSCSRDGDILRRLTLGDRQHDALHRRGGSWAVWCRRSVRRREGVPRQPIAAARAARFTLDR